MYVTECTRSIFIVLILLIIFTPQENHQHQHHQHHSQHHSQRHNVLNAQHTNSIFSGELMEEEGNSKMAPNNFNQGNKLGRGGLLFCFFILQTKTSSFVL